MMNSQCIDKSYACSNEELRNYSESTHTMEGAWTECGGL